GLSRRSPSCTGPQVSDGQDVPGAAQVLGLQAVQPNEPAAAARSLVLGQEPGAEGRAAWGRRGLDGGHRNRKRAGVVDQLFGTKKSQNSGHYAPPNSAAKPPRTPTPASRKIGRPSCRGEA